MKILFFLGHPAHFHLFKNTIEYLRKDGKEIIIIIKKKDILEDLLRLSDMDYINILPSGRGEGKTGIIIGLIKKNIGLFNYCIKNKPDLMIGTPAEIAHIGKLLGIPSINVSEDDVTVIKEYAMLTYPFSKHILSPESCNNGRWNKKTIFYKGFHKLAYLHPGYFNPDLKVLKKYIPVDKPYFLLRFVKLNAHHDEDIRGLNDDVAANLIGLLKKHGNVFISSERMLPNKFKKYKLEIDPLEIHHFVAFAKILISDSQSMSVEAAMLGTPSVRFSDFTGRIGVLEELETKYQLTYGVHPDFPEKLFNIINELIANQTLNQIHNKRRLKMLSDKIDVTAFFNWFFSKYPESFYIMESDPSYQNKFMNKDIKVSEKFFIK